MDARRAQRHRAHVGDRGRHAEAAGQVDHRRRADPIEGVDRGRVERVGQGVGGDRDAAVAGARARSPVLGGGLVVLGDRRVAQRGRRGQGAALEAGGVDHRLPHRAGLAARHDQAIEAAELPAHAAGHRRDVAGRVIPHHRRGLGGRAVVARPGRGRGGQRAIDRVGQRRLGRGLDRQPAGRRLEGIDSSTRRRT
jgi:hypothetical protein